MRFGPLPALLSLILFSASLWAQMTPNAPVKNFRFPRFGDNGYTQWVLQGAKGIYDSEEQIRVEEMALRVYSGDERMAKELTLDSPKATIRLKENRAFSEEAIKIVGANFTISGTGWEWIGETKEIIVQADTVVEFTQAITGGLSESASADELKRTVIKSDQLVLQTTEKEYNFEFSGSVRAISGDLDLKSNVLIALADVPDGEKEGAPAIEPGKLDSVRQIIAREEVVIVQQGRTVRAGEAEFLTREERAVLTGSPEIEVAGAFLSGAVVRSQSGELVIEGSPSAGRAQMILTETGGLGLQGVSALSQETIVLADTITMQEAKTGNRFLFEGEVEVMSGAVQLKAAKMTILSDKAKQTDGGDAKETESDLKVGEVSQLIAEGGVRIEQEGQIATGEKVIFYPSQQRCELTGQPKVMNGEAVITGNRMELEPQLALIYGDSTDKVRVELPEMPDLGYKTFTPTLGQDAEPKEAETVKPEITVVQSELLRMVEEPNRTLFSFSDAVEVSATNLEATCDRLDVIAVDKPVVASANDSGEGLEVERIEAHESVVIKQSGRTATASRAFILPKEGKVILEDNAVVNDERGRVSGFRMTLLQGERRAIVEGGGGPGQERARITLPALPGSKHDKDE